MTTRQLLGATCLQAGVFTIAGAMIWVGSGREILAFVTFDWIEVVYGIVIAAAMIASGYLLFALFPRFSERMVREQAYSLAFLKNKLGMGPVIVLSLCAGIWEEAFFRGGLLTLASDHLPVWLAVIITSVLFALIHLARLKIAIIIALIGGVFAVLYLALESLLAVMIGHALYDIWALWRVQNEMHRLGVFDCTQSDIDGTP
ncbi:CPBP family intramembrane metalloprotease [Erythrobacter sp. SCSIO 43205]|uniref:CPBP family intramembrane glutamic endopeptidase n=1 Tax=Erythrobacter sp. SCSIO 43205 TaxID=2779361 RepID=UPI001CA89105|nr:CPBP family intramembrane glutamic endopeptidase [Erythrobacter sp. SCSIO 43205]UAB77109.1 CPBP family intramembrane metalloprotease [Erythrobacter sp. SCSIO 43205]